jgi:5-methylcytosine-specific restriction endonuclease McrA
LESLRQWKLKNPLWNKQYKESHQDEIREYNQEYSAREDVKIGRAVRERKRQARKNGAEYPLTVKEWLWILEICGYTCLRCGAVANITQDHMIPLSRGGNHSADNVQPLCLSCNSSKYDTAIDYRSAWVRKLVEEYINGNRWRGLQLRGKAQQEYQAAQTQV